MALTCRWRSRPQHHASKPGRTASDDQVRLERHNFRGDLAHSRKCPARIPAASVMNSRHYIAFPPRAQAQVPYWFNLAQWQRPSLGSAHRLMTNRTMSTLVTGGDDRRSELAMRCRYKQDSIKLMQISLTACCVNC